jgi:hypothetical protein
MFDVVTADVNYDQALLAELGQWRRSPQAETRRLVIRSM